MMNYNEIVSMIGYSNRPTASKLLLALITSHLRHFSLCTDAMTCSHCVTVVCCADLSALPE